MFDETDRTYHLKPAAEHPDRAEQRNGLATTARQRVAADYQAGAAESLRREVARQLG